MAIVKYTVYVEYEITDIETNKKIVCGADIPVTTYFKPDTEPFNELIEVAVDNFMEEVEDGLCDTETAKLVTYSIFLGA